MTFGRPSGYKWPMAVSGDAVARWPEPVYLHYTDLARRTKRVKQDCIKCEEAGSRHGSPLGTVPRGKELRNNSGANGAP